MMALGDFSAQADAYQRSRPTYPIELVDLLIDDAKVRPGDAVADFGAGTGLFTQLLVERGFAVSAIEPNQSMRDRAEVPDARWLSGSFETSGLDSSSQRWAVAAQAFHWANPPMALPEVRRILQPGCLFTVVWNDRFTLDHGVIQWTESLIRECVPEFDEAYRDLAWGDVLQSTGDFEFVNSRTFRHLVPMSRHRYQELWRSHNRLNTIAGPDRFRRFYEKLSEELDRQSCQQVDVYYDCKSWSARRRD